VNIFISMQENLVLRILDTSNMVELGIQAGRPVVTVNMQYVMRISMFGHAGLI
jgi:hypothetical protein